MAKKDADGRARAKKGRAGVRRVLIPVAAVLVLLLAAAAVRAFVNLPASGSRVDNDAASGISPRKDAGAVDAVSGSLLAGAPAVPWTIFEKQTSGEQQVFVARLQGRRLGDAGPGTVNGASSAQPDLPRLAQLRPDQGGRSPLDRLRRRWPHRAVDHLVRGRHRPVRPRGDLRHPLRPDQDKWVFAGSGEARHRRAPGAQHPHRPRTPRTRRSRAATPPATRPTRARGSCGRSSGPTRDQIFVVKPIGPGTATCPPGTKPAGGAPVGGFCWQQVGVERVAGRRADPPSLNVDPSAHGIEPDIAFTGPNDAVPWVVWYEIEAGPFGVNNERVFAAKAVAGGTVDGTVDGGFHWEAVGKEHRRGQVLDTSGAQAPARASTTKAAENLCTLNRNVDADAEDPKVAAGTMTGGARRCPGSSGPRTRTASRGSSPRGSSAARTSRSSTAASRSRAPDGDAANPDITFAKNTPYVTYHQHVGKRREAVRRPPQGRRESQLPRSTARRDLALDRRSTSASLADLVRLHGEPVQRRRRACQGGAPGKAFFLFNDGAKGKRQIFAEQVKGGTRRKGRGR